MSSKRHPFFEQHVWAVEIEVKGNPSIDGPAGGSFAFPNWADAPLKDVQQRIEPGFSG
jgi:type VI secretion system secreted protein VgrG